MKEVPPCDPHTTHSYTHTAVSTVRKDEWRAAGVEVNDINIIKIVIGCPEVRVSTHTSTQFPHKLTSEAEIRKHHSIGLSN